MPTRSPTPIDQLRLQSTQGLPLASEYAIRNWLNSAQSLLQTASSRVADDQQGRGKDGIALEEAYVAFRKAAEIIANRIVGHPGYNTMRSEKKAEYDTWIDVKGQLGPAATAQAEIAELLRKRFVDWEDKNGKLQSTSRTAAATNGRAMNNTSPKPSSSISVASTTPPPPTSIADRMAALRVAGMKTGSVPPSSSKAIPSPTKSSHLPPIPPKKPEALVGRTLGLSPPGSPQSRPLRLDSKTRDRSGSAPPIIPCSPTSAQFPRAGSSSPPRSPQSPPVQLSPSTSHHPYRSASPQRNYTPSAPPVQVDDQYSTLNSLSTPSLATYPSLSELEATFDNQPRTAVSESSHSLASAPLSDPRTGRSPLPPAPLPFEPLPLENQPMLSPNLTPASSRPPSIASSVSTSNSTPVPSSTNPSFSIPFTNEVLPAALYAYLDMALGVTGKGPRVLLLDVRTRDEFDRGRIIGETLCLEPLTLRSGISSTAIESSLILSPALHQQLFAARHLYDVLVIYDRASISIPTSAPTATSSDSKRALWNLSMAIYDNEFTKNLRRQPVLLKGGWEAWERVIGEKGIIRDRPLDQLRSDENERTDEFGVLEARKASNRRTSILSSNGPGSAPILRNPSDHSSYVAYVPGSGANDIMSPRVAMPPVAVQRPGQSFEPAYQPIPYQTAYSQPPTDRSSYGTSASPIISRTRSDFGDTQVQAQSFSGYSVTPRTPIDYPQLPGLPPIILSTRPNLSPRGPILPQTPLARPQAIQPPPLRSSALSLQPYPSSGPVRSKFSNEMSFGDDWIGLTGLKNLGNTCYMNSTIQCLSATIPFARYFKDGSYKRDINYVNTLGTKGALALAVAGLIQSMWAESYNFLSPVTFREQICLFAPQFRGSDQHDAQEFLGFLLDGLHEDLNYIVHKPRAIEMTPDRERDLETLPQQIMSEREWEIYRRRNDSWVVQCFQGQFRNQMKCLTCSQTSTTYNTFMPLSIPVPAGRGISRVTLEECIVQFVKEEILDKDDAWYCPRCKCHRKATKKLTISRLPPILIIHLKRFSFKGHFSDKVETQVQYPLDGLDLTGFVPPPLFDKRAPPLTAPAKGQVYDLYSLTNHFGNLSSGHYTAYIRNHKEWYDVSDSKYTRIDPLQVQSARSAYILYYRLR